jgi:autophagy-related protein 9
MRVIQLIVDLRKLSELRNFFIHLLDIPDSDMQTVSWPTVVERLMALRDANPLTSEAGGHREFFKAHKKQRMDAHDIANRIMRRENYLIALFNKDILDLTVPLPFFRNRGMWLTKMLEFNLQICIIDFFIGPNGNVRKAFLSSANKKGLSDG